MQIELDETTIQWLEEYKAASGSNKDMRGLIDECVFMQRAQFVTGTERKAPWQPIYTDIFVLCEKDESGAFAVSYESEEYGELISYLRLATPQEVSRKVLRPRFDYATEDTIDIEPLQGRPITLFVEIQHRTDYPFAAVDYTEVVDYSDPIETLFGEPRQPRRFCTAAIVATPQMKLI